MKTHTILEKFVRRFRKGREYNNRLYGRYLTWNTRQISLGNLGKKIPRSEVRDMGLAIRNFNGTGENEI